METATARTDSSLISETVVDPEAVEPEFIAAMRSHRENTVVDSLASDGDVVRVSVPLVVPPKRDGSQEAIEHEATVLIRRAALTR